MCDYIVCGKCGYRYDPVEVRGGICDDCREAAEKEEAAARWERMAARCMKEQAGGQMVLMPAGLTR